MKTVLKEIYNRDNKNEQYAYTPRALYNLLNLRKPPNTKPDIQHPCRIEKPRAAYHTVKS